MRHYLKTFLFLLFFAMVISPAFPSKEIRLLNIGNSFTWSLAPYLGEMVKHEGKHTLIHKQCSVGGCELSRHWRYVEEFEKEGKRAYSWVRDEEGKEIFISLKEALGETAWDVVTVQQASHESWRPECYEPWGEKLVGYVRQHAPQAQVMVQQTWAYRTDAPRLVEWKLSQEEMYHRLWLAYEAFSAKLELPLIPVGEAIQLARVLQKGVFVHYDWKEAEKLTYPQVPDQSWSFINGFFWHTNEQGARVPLTDTIHLNARGRYLQALVWYGMLFGEEPTQVTYLPKEIEAEDGAFLRQVASLVLRKRPVRH